MVPPAARGQYLEPVGGGGLLGMGGQGEEALCQRGAACSRVLPFLPRLPSAMWFSAVVAAELNHAWCWQKARESPSNMWHGGWLAGRPARRVGSNFLPAVPGGREDWRRVVVLQARLPCGATAGGLCSAPLLSLERSPPVGAVVLVH